MSKIDIDILKNELRRGTQVLAVLSQLDEKEYGYSLLEKLSQMKINIEAGTLYPLLRRLESQELLESEWDTTEARPRKYYKISTYGSEVLKELTNEWRFLNKEMERILGGE